MDPTNQPVKLIFSHLPKAAQEALDLLAEQDEFYYWLEGTPEHIGQLHEWLQKFINEYNTWRPHQALDYKSPQEFVRLCIRCRDTTS